MLLCPLNIPAVTPDDIATNNPAPTDSALPSEVKTLSPNNWVREGGISTAFLQLFKISNNKKHATHHLKLTIEYIDLINFMIFNN
jgi:hypothetical protein